MTSMPSENLHQTEPGQDRLRNVNPIMYPLCAVCAALFVADLLVHKHAHFDFEHWFGFYGFVGFASCLALVLAAKVLRVILKRDEDYYDQ